VLHLRAQQNAEPITWSTMTLCGHPYIITPSLAPLRVHPIENIIVDFTVFGIG
jgi:hypothetical protein